MSICDREVALHFCFSQFLSVLTTISPKITLGIWHLLFKISFEFDEIPL